MSAVITLNSRNYFQESASRSQTVEEKAWEFFTRAELTDRLQGIWNSIKYMPFDTVLRLLKAVALVTVVILLAQSISLAGILALAGTIGGLLFAAISNVLVWLIYIPMYAVRTSDFAYSLLVALGLAWLAGVTPLVALIFSPLMLFGFRQLERSELTKLNVSGVFTAIGGMLDRVNVGAGIQKAASSVAGFASSLWPRRTPA